MTRRKKPVLALDFDGVLRIDDDTPTPNALRAVRAYLEHFEVNVYAARSARPGGPAEMRRWLKKHGFPVERMKFPKGKPSIHALIDDQAFRFQGTWPKIDELKNLKPWHQMEECNGCGGKGYEWSDSSGSEECVDCGGSGRLSRRENAERIAMRQPQSTAGLCFCGTGPAHTLGDQFCSYRKKTEEEMQQGRRASGWKPEWEWGRLSS